MVPGGRAEQQPCSSSAAATPWHALFPLCSTLLLYARMQNPGLKPYGAGCPFCCRDARLLPLHQVVSGGFCLALRRGEVFVFVDAGFAMHAARCACLVARAERRAQKNGEDAHHPDKQPGSTSIVSRV